MNVVWNPKAIPDDEDAVVLTSHQHSRHPTMILGYFQATRQDRATSAVFAASDFDLPFREAYVKAKAYAQAHHIQRLYINDPYGLGSMEVDDR